MRILYVTTHLDNGGAENLVADMAIFSKNEGFEVTVIMILDRKGIPYQKLQENNIKVINLRSRTLFSLKIPFMIKKISKEFDIVHTHTYYAQIYSSFFVKKRKLITTEHSTQNNRRNLKIFKIIDSFMYFRHFKIISITESVEKNLKQWIFFNSPQKFQVINNGIEVNKYFNEKKIEKSDIGFSKKDIVLISVGRLEPVKNQLFLIDVFSEIQNPNLKLILIGNGSLKTEIVEKIKTKGVTDKITLLENRSDVNIFLNASDIFILPSLWEGFGLSALEAAVSGNLLVLSNIDGLKDMINQVTGEAIFFDPKNKIELSKAINKAISALKNKREEVNIDYVKKNLSIEYMMSNYLNIYKRSKGG